MRLIRLRIRNIASLKGEHEINFSHIQGQSPLFAITGETGAGKSSILNAIGLALYGQIYKRNVNQLDVVTLGEKDGSIELIFQVKGKCYLADWRAKVRKQNGEPYSTPQTPSRNLYTLEGDTFESSKTITLTSATELLNLDFDQFCKCIILNQGEFAKFLTSSFTDRKDILEKLYPGEVLESMGRELKLELDHLQSAKNEVEIKLGELRGEGQSGEVLKEERSLLETKLKALEASLLQIEKLAYHFTSLSSYHEKYLENEKKKDLIKKDMALETTRLNLLIKSGEEIHLRYQAARTEQETKLPVLQTYLKKEETLKLLEEGWLTLSKRIETLKVELTSVEKELQIKEDEERLSLEKLKASEEALTLPLAALKACRGDFDTLFELFSEMELLSQELKGKAERLKELELTGLEVKSQLEKLHHELAPIPKDLRLKESELERKKQDLSGRLEKKQRAQIKAEELKKNALQLSKEISAAETKISEFKEFISKTQQGLLPLETTLKLQELLNATEVCIEHAIAADAKECPVCESPVATTRWGEIKEKLKQTDLEQIRSRFEEGTKSLIKAQEEEKIYLRKLLEHQAQLVKIEQEILGLEALCQEQLPTLESLDLEISDTKKLVWEVTRLEKELEAKNQELLRARESYALLKGQMTKLEELKESKASGLEKISANLKELIPVIDRNSIRDLKLEVRQLSLYLGLEGALEKITQEKNFLREKKLRAETEGAGLSELHQEQVIKITSLKEEIGKALNGERASEIIRKINDLAAQTAEEWTRQVDAQKKQELTLKDSNGRLYQLEELTKDYDLHYSQELHQTREIAKTVEDAELQRLKVFDLGFSSSHELFIPFKDLISSRKETLKNSVNQCRMDFASAVTRLESWEKIQDKIQLLEIKAREINESLSRKLRLFEVLGKDELRTFVLSLVEENLIHQTNEELAKLCQGRYEIVHQTRSLKMTPEFYILDKFREGGRRKVSTLSGGETFMVSLAMALGLAEMTRGQAEIDSLFIDEGFGTLDQESLEDVLDMLSQIQTRGLMVGIISHVKALTSALPVNLVLKKHQDGTSNISLQFN